MGAVNVVHGNGELAGIITDGDLRRAVQKRSPVDLEALRAETFMTRDPVTLGPGELAHNPLKLMEKRPSQISVLPVVNGACHCVGLSRLHDVVRSGL
ncbi:MAG: CBS domain-containing protein [bacterium]